MARKNKYDSNKHEGEAIPCQRRKCPAKNAPKSSPDFNPNCWKCGADLNVEADVEVGEVVEVDLIDIHESGAGVGKMDSGLIVLVEDAMPEGRYKVKIEKTRKNHATGSKVCKISDGSEEENTEKNEENSDGRRVKYSRGEDFWGE